MKFKFVGEVEKDIFPFGVLHPGEEFEEERPEQIEALLKAVHIKVVKDKPVKKIDKKQKEEGE